jgi:NAD(P)-dependent dehydrogenase (short-subunit alcohol dehydrogenase family)
MPVALITGSSTGIGCAAAIHFARNGYETYATMRSPDAGGDAIRRVAEAEGLPIQTLALDVESDASVHAAVGAARERSGAIDVLVNNAGIGWGGPIEETSDADLKKVFETNFFGALRMVRAVLPQMRERGDGAIINVTSLGGRVTFPSTGPYCATKHALEAASEALAMEVAPYGVRVAIVEPGSSKSCGCLNRV